MSQAMCKISTEFHSDFPSTPFSKRGGSHTDDGGRGDKRVVVISACGIRDNRARLETRALPGEHLTLQNGARKRLLKKIVLLTMIFYPNM